MSGKLMGQIYSRDLPPNERELLLAMADHANDAGGNCFPGNERLAWKLGCSVRKIQQGLRKLEERGAISIISNAKGGRGKRLEYQINLSVLPVKPELSKGAKSSTLNDEKGCKKKGCKFQHPH
jgi:hypothetical protein